jgi:hypothetical protein
MRASVKSPLAVRRVMSKSVFGHVQNGIELGLPNCHRLVDYFRDGIGPACGRGEVRHSGGSPEQPEHRRHPNGPLEVRQPMSTHARSYP